MLGPDCWLTGQETGYASYPMWHGVDTTDNTTHGRPVDPDSAHGNPHGTWFKVWESDCSNYGGCHPWFYGGKQSGALPVPSAADVLFCRGCQFRGHVCAGHGLLTAPAAVGLFPDVTVR